MMRRRLTDANHTDDCKGKTPMLLQGTFLVKDEEAHEDPRARGVDGLHALEQVGVFAHRHPEAPEHSLADSRELVHVTTEEEGSHRREAGEDGEEHDTEVRNVFGGAEKGVGHNGRLGLEVEVLPDVQDEEEEEEPLEGDVHIC